MKIAQVAPLTEAVPPKLYGGTERVVAYLTDALVELGHEVTLVCFGRQRDQGHARSDLAEGLAPRSESARTISCRCSCSWRRWRDARTSST